MQTAVSFPAVLRFLHHPFVRKHFAQGLKFAVCGGLGMTIDLGMTVLLVERYQIDPRIAYIPATGLAVIFVFLANKFFTFKNRERQVGSQLIKFAFVYGVAIISNLSISYLLYWIGVHYLLAKIIAIGIGAVWNYVMSHMFVFKKSQREEVVIV